MTATQPDLWADEHEAAREAIRRVWSTPATCPSCGTREPSGYLLASNHGYLPDDATDGHGRPQGSDHPIYGRRCVAQYLVTNHITYYARRDEPDALAERMERGRALRLDVDAIATAARKEAP